MKTGLIRLCLFATAMSVIVALPAQGAFRCGSSLVDVGDWPAEVEERCGQPDYVATYPASALAGVGVIEEIEHWYYNPGPQGFIRRLEFRNGKLSREQSLGYGFRGKSAGKCTPAAVDQGTSEFELISRCGEPLSRRVEWRTSAERRGSHYHHTVQTVVPVEKWLYGFGSNRFRRIITLENGRVTDIETAKKPH